MTTTTTTITPKLSPNRTFAARDEVLAHVAAGGDLAGARIHRGTDLRGADLTCADLHGARLEGVLHDDDTVWPDDCPSVP